MQEANHPAQTPDFEMALRATFDEDTYKGIIKIFILILA